MFAFNVDDVTRLINRIYRPELQHLDVNWEDEITPNHLHSIAIFAQLGTPPPLPFQYGGGGGSSDANSAASSFDAGAKDLAASQRINAHVKPLGLQKNLTDLLRQDAEYKSLLQPKECNIFYCTF